MDQGPYLQMRKSGYLKPQSQQERLIKQTCATMVQPFLLVLVFALPTLPHLKEFPCPSQLGEERMAQETDGYALIEILSKLHLKTV